MVIKTFLEDALLDRTYEVDWVELGDTCCEDTIPCEGKWIFNTVDSVMGEGFIGAPYKALSESQL